MVDAINIHIECQQFGSYSAKTEEGRVTYHHHWGGGHNSNYYNSNHNIHVLQK